MREIEDYEQPSVAVPALATICLILVIAIIFILVYASNVTTGLQNQIASLNSENNILKRHSITPNDCFKKIQLKEIELNKFNIQWKKDIFNRTKIEADLRLENAKLETTLIKANSAIKILMKIVEKNKEN